MKRKLLQGPLVVTPEGIVKTDIVLEGGRVSFAQKERPGDEVLEVSGKYLLPGFVDIHFHGYGLFDLTMGRYDPKSGKGDKSSQVYEEGFEGLRKKLPEFGVTGFYLANWNTSLENLQYCYGRLADYMQKYGEELQGARLLGGFLEGPFINKQMSGAQNPDMTHEPEIDFFEKIEDGGSIKLANVVPDDGRLSFELIEYLTKKGIAVGMGHTAATCEQVAEAIKAGLKYCVHFTNGPTGGSYKPFAGGGAVEAVLKFDELFAELICDGYHVNPVYIRDIIKRKGTKRIVGITDCMMIAGSDLTDFRVEEIKGKVSADGQYLQVAGKGNTLFGSNLTMIRGFNNLLNWLMSDMEGIWNRRHEGMGLEEAVSAAAQIYASNPCELTGLASQGYGRIVEGAKGDLCVLDIEQEGGRCRAEVEMTIVDGEVVYARG